MLLKYLIAAAAVFFFFAMFSDREKGGCMDFTYAFIACVVCLTAMVIAG